MKCLKIIIILIFFSEVSLAKTYHIYPEQIILSGNDLSESFTLNTILRSTHKIRPGDSILLHNGVYEGSYLCNLRGSANKPITIISAPGEWATIEGKGENEGKTKGLIHVNGEFLIFKDLEIRNSTLKRESDEKGSHPKDIPSIAGLYINGPNNKFINLIIHDNTGNNISFWNAAKNSEIYGCIVYYSGWDGKDRGHGHNIYTQNGSPEFSPTEYHVGKIVSYNSIYYQTIKRHGNGLRKWAAHKIYPEGAKVFYDGNFYVSIKKIEKNIKPDQDTRWLRVSGELVDSHLPTNKAFWKVVGPEDPAGFKTIANNFIFSSHRIGIASYTENGVINNYRILDNTVFENGQLSNYGRQWNLLVGGLNPSKNIYALNNTFYFNSEHEGRPVQLGYKNYNEGAVVRGNSFINQSLYLRKWDKLEVNENFFFSKEALRIRFNKSPDWTKYLFENNLYVTNSDNAFNIEGGILKTGNLKLLQDKYKLEKGSEQSRVGTAKNILRITENKYDDSKLYITVENFEGLDQVAIEVDDFIKKGDFYKVIDVQNYFGDPIIEGEYTGGSIVIPMNLTEVAKPLGKVANQPVHTEKILGTFVVLIN